MKVSIGNFPDKPQINEKTNQLLTLLSEFLKQTESF